MEGLLPPPEAASQVSSSDHPYHLVSAPDGTLPEEATAGREHGKFLDPLLTALDRWASGYRQKPALSTALLLASLTQAFCIGSLLDSPWIVFVSGDDGTSRADGHVSLLEARTCISNDAGRTDYGSARVCEAIALRDIALKLDYLRVAGGVAFAFTLFSALLGAVVLAQVRGRRMQGAEDAAQPWLLQVVPSLQRHTAAVGVLASWSCLQLVGWASYVGVVRAHLNVSDFAAVLADAAPSVTWSWGGGLIVVVAGWVFSLAALAIVWTCPAEPASAAFTARLASLLTAVVGRGIARPVANPTPAPIAYPPATGDAGEGADVEDGAAGAPAFVFPSAGGGFGSGGASGSVSSVSGSGGSGAAGGSAGGNSISSLAAAGMLA